MPLTGGLVLEAGPEDGEDHQLGEGEKKLTGGGAGGFRGANEGAEVLEAGELANLIESHAEQAGHFHIGEELLAGTNSKHTRISGCALQARYAWRKAREQLKCHRHDQRRDSK